MVSSGAARFAADRRPDMAWSFAVGDERRGAPGAGLGHAGLGQLQAFQEARYCFAVVVVESSRAVLLAKLHSHLAFELTSGHHQVAAIRQAVHVPASSTSQTRAMLG